MESGEVMYPSGHARNTEANLQSILDHKNVLLGDLVFTDSADRAKFVQNLQQMKNSSDIRGVYNFDWGTFKYIFWFSFFSNYFFEIFGGPWKICIVKFVENLFVFCSTKLQYSIFQNLQCYQKTANMKSHSPIDGDGSVADSTFSKNTGYFKSGDRRMHAWLINSYEIDYCFKTFWNFNLK